MASKVQVSNEARNYVRRILKEHQQNKKSKDLMEQALRYPYQETDENIGGGRTNRISKPVEDEYDRVWTNGDFLSMVEEVGAVERVLHDIKDETAYRIIEERYFNLETIAEGKKRMQSWVKVANNIPGCPEETCRKIERAIVDRIAKELRLR